jgi:hypothetical protein
MDLYRTIHDLLEERKRLDSMIARLERMQAAGSPAAPPKRRGRRAMNEDQRREVSERMKRYWEQRRQAAP